MAEKLDAIQANTPEQNDALLREELVTGADAAEFETAVRAETFKLKVREEAQRRHSGIAKAELTLVSEADILARPAPDWWIDGLLQKGTVAVFAGEAGIGKSFMSLHMARCIATGQRFFYRDTSKGTVLYVVAEGASAFGKRARAWDSANYTTPPEGSMNYLESGVNLSDPESVQRLGALLDDLQPDIVILDTLSQLGGVENENDAGQLSKVFRTAKELRDHKEGSTVILVHHVNKSSGGVRGSSVIRANADTVIVAKSSKGGFCLSTEVSDDGKQKDGAPLKLEGFYLDDHAGSAVVRQANTVESDTDWNIVRDLLADASAKSKADLRIACGIPKATATDSAYKAWSRKWKRWTAADGPLIVSADGKTVTLAGITTPTAEAA
ncbi:AAA family ATPase [Herbiconiux sp. VKM Ac-2851]|uniref:AAA family ATPase n=1 Tax=Herbiconiux sp. VKM Ac-2851 TaxID=2739025 RepID=UPI0015634666|nr:AAA family ATPase [Herbiconiux sp. VKM Ac-2851]